MSTAIPRSRSAFRSLLTANPNYFGTLAGASFAESFPLVEAKQADTGFEEIGCVSYSPEHDRLEATVVVKRSSGYGGGRCTTGTREWVRFYVDHGAGWVDAGSGSARVFDLPTGKDCAGSADHPYVLVVGVALGALRKFCATPVLPRVRAILSWEHEPTPSTPGYLPVWGEVQEDTVQVAPRRSFHPADLSDLLAPLKIDPDVLHGLLEEIHLPIPVPEPGPIDPYGPVALNPQPLPPVAAPPVPLAVSTLARLYAPEKLKVLATHAVDRSVAKLARMAVPAHRFAASEVSAAAAGALAPAAIATQSAAFAAAGLSWGKVLGALDEGKGDTTYEQLECLGLDDAAGQLVATFRVKRPTGFSGPPCSAGSTEHVAFWADLGDDCRYTYLGTAQVSSHDFITMPAGGLSYAAVLPVDLGTYRRLCEEPGLHRLRAVLSWNTPPSTIDPDAVPHWGNRLDTHVHVLPGRRYDGTARIALVGDVATGDLDPVTGITLPGAHLAHNGASLDIRGCPFAGRVTVQGPLDPALAGATYRLLVRDVDAGGSAVPVMSPLYVVDGSFHGSGVTPAADGWLPWPVWNTNLLGTLGFIESSGDHLWNVDLEVQGLGVVDSRRFQLDNTLNAGSADPANAAHLAIDPNQLSLQGCGKFTQGMTIHGTFDARDTWFGSWGFSLLPTGLPSTALTTSVSSTVLEAPVGSTWSLSTAGLTPCGYVLRLRSADRAIVNSAWTGRSVTVDVGFCIE